MRRLSQYVGALALASWLAAAAIAAEGTLEESVLAQGNRAASPTPAASPGTTERDRVSGANEVGIGRATGAVKSSGDEGGTAAGMPGKAPASP